MKIQQALFVGILLCVMFAQPFFSYAEKANENADYTVGPEDILDVRVLGQPELHRTVEVSQEGIISFPLIGKIKASGRTLFELEEDIAHKLAENKYLIGAQISIEVKRYGSMKVFLLGEVKKPGRYFLKGKTHIFDILAEAGGLTDDAGRTIVILRSGKAGPGAVGQKSGREIVTVDLDDIIQGKTPENSYVKPGDIIQVPAAPHFYVTGEVRKPGEYKWEKHISVRRAIAMAGGPTDAGAIGRTTIQRFKNGSEVELEPQMTDIVKPEDIIIVPQSYF